MGLKPHQPDLLFWPPLSRAYCSGPGGSRNGVWSTIGLPEKQRVALEWISKRDPQLWDEMLSYTPYLIEKYHGTYLMKHILDAVHVLRDTPGLLPLLAKTTRYYCIGNSRYITRERQDTMGAVHEVLRLGHLTTPKDPVDGIGYVEEVFPSGKGTTSSGKEQIEIDGVLRSGIAIECKLATNGLKELDEKQKDQAQRYAQLLRSGKISGVQYHITTKELGPAVIKFLAETIEGVKIFHYGSFINPATGQLTTQSRQIDVDPYLWDL